MRHPRTTLTTAALTLAALTALACSGGGGDDDGEDDDFARPAPGASVDTPADPPASGAGGASKTAPKAAPRPAPPATIAEGVWHVGNDVAPGTYRLNTAIAPDGSCYWQKARDAEGQNILSSGFPTGGRPEVALRAGQWFTTTGCGGWTRVGK